MCSCVPRSSEVAPPWLVGSSTWGALTAPMRATRIWMWKKSTKFPAALAAPWQQRSLAKQLWGLPAWRKHLFSGDVMIFFSRKQSFFHIPHPLTLSHGGFYPRLCEVSISSAALWMSGAISVLSRKNSYISHLCLHLMAVCHVEV